MSQHYTLHVPVEGTDNIKRYPRVGVRHFSSRLRPHALPRQSRTRMRSHSVLAKPKSAGLLRNHNNETGEEYFTVKLDFPVGATELLAFPPKPRDVQAADEPAGEERAA